MTPFLTALTEGGKALPVAAIVLAFLLTALTIFLIRGRARAGVSPGAFVLAELVPVLLLALTCLGLLYFSVDRRFESEIPASGISQKKGHSFVWKVPFAGSRFFKLQHDDQGSRASRLQLFEDGKPLAGSHSSHASIADQGAGRFSHWQNHTLYFSSSDGSDPRSSGRKYHVRAPLELKPAFRNAVPYLKGVLVLLMLCIAFRLTIRLPAAWGYARISVVFPAFLAIIGGLFCVNKYLNERLHVIAASDIYKVEGFAYGYDFPPLPAGFRTSSKSPGISDKDGSVFEAATEFSRLVNEGKGLYLSEGRALAFSTPDNSDPRKNGITYVAEREVLPAAWLVCVLIVALMISVFSWARLRLSRGTLNVSMVGQPVTSGNPISG